MLTEQGLHLFEITKAHWKSLYFYRVGYPRGLMHPVCENPSAQQLTSTFEPTVLCRGRTAVRILEPDYFHLAYLDATLGNPLENFT